MIIEEYRFTWKTFEEEIPESHKIFLVRSSKKTIKDAQWAFVSDNSKMIYAHDLKWHHYVSKCKKWLWCYDTSIEPIIV